MSDPLYGDRFPLGDAFPDPVTYATPDEVGELAIRSAELLIAQDPLNFNAAEMHMRAIPGLFSGYGNLDAQTYGRFGSAAKNAVGDVAAASEDYLREFGDIGEVVDLLNILEPNGASEYLSRRSVIQKMQNTVLLRGMDEGARKRRLLSRAFQPGTTLTVNPKDGYVVEAPEQRDQDQRAQEKPYSEARIKDVLRVFGVSMGPIITDFFANAPLNIDGRSIVHHASSSLVASIPTELR